MAITYSLISKQIIGSGGAASVTFSNIPQTFTDLKVVGSARTTQAQVYGTTLIGFNGSSSNVAYLRMYGDGSGASSDTGTTGVISIDNGANATSNTFGNFEVYIPNYRSSSAKSYSTDSVSETNATTIYTQLLAGLWNPGTQAAITSITLTAGASANYAQYSTFYLYGIQNS